MNNIFLLIIGLAIIGTVTYYLSVGYVDIWGIGTEITLTLYIIFLGYALFMIYKFLESTNIISKSWMED